MRKREKTACRFVSVIYLDKGFGFRLWSVTSP